MRVYETLVSNEAIPLATRHKDTCYVRVSCFEKRLYGWQFSFEKLEKGDCVYITDQEEIDIIAHLVLVGWLDLIGMFQ